MYECLPNNPDIFSLSGPSFAHEVASRKPVLLVIGGDLQKSKVIQEKLSSESLRIYQSKDIIGVELSAALKNVFAIAAGILDGLNTGQNGRAALIVRGLAELRRFIIAMGGDSTTVFGIAGLGDLVLTCTGSNSRNHRLGTMIAQGKSAEEILSSVKWVAEGYFTAPAALVMANKMGVSLPITEQVVQAINNEIRPQEAINLLMTRPLKKEFPI